jgi:hypothetical protein
MSGKIIGSVLALAKDPKVRRLAIGAAQIGGELVIARFLPGRKAGGGRLASFHYRDAKGRESDRTVRVYKTKGRLLIGYCLKRGALRTFRRDRMSGFSELE